MRGKDEVSTTNNTSWITIGNELDVLDVQSITKDPSGGSMCRAGFFDLYQEDDETGGGSTIAFLGS